MTFEVDAEVLLPAARVAERAAADLRDAGVLLAFGPTGTDDAAALERLRHRTHRVAAHIGSNARTLEAFVHEAEEVDGQVSLSLLMLCGKRWR